MLFLIILVISITTVVNVQLPGAGLTTPGLIRYWGYPAEIHKVVTKDGYILTLHRIPHGKLNHTSTKEKRPVVFVQHGMIGSSASFVVNLPNQSLGFMLADAGFDVWLGNTRGSPYSRNHVSFSNKSNEFWDFTFDEMAQYDLPAMIDYTLQHTGQEQVYYVGFSQGNMIAYAALSENMDLQKKIKMTFSLGPVTRMRYVNFLFQLVAEYEPEIKDMVKKYGINEFLTETDNWPRLSEILCSKYLIVCRAIFSILAGVDLKSINGTRIPLYVTYFPAGTSVKNTIQYLQIIKSDVFRHFDYGVEGNIKQYSSSDPPEYDLRKIRVPTVMIYGSEDAMASPEDAKWMTSRLPNVIKFMEIKGYNHLDFIWAVSAGKLFHQKIIEMIRDSQ